MHSTSSYHHIQQMTEEYKPVYSVPGNHLRLHYDVLDTQFFSEVRKSQLHQCDRNWMFKQTSFLEVHWGSSSLVTLASPYRIPIWLHSGISTNTNSQLHCDSNCQYPPYSLNVTYDAHTQKECNWGQQNMHGCRKTNLFQHIYFQLNIYTYMNIIVTA